jgi:hypothetical protein
MIYRLAADITDKGYAFIGAGKRSHRETGEAEFLPGMDKRRDLTHTFRYLLVVVHIIGKDIVHIFVLVTEPEYFFGEMVAVAVTAQHVNRFVCPELRKRSFHVIKKD